MRKIEQFILPIALLGIIILTLAGGIQFHFKWDSTDQSKGRTNQPNIVEIDFDKSDHFEKTISTNDLFRFINARSGQMIMLRLIGQKLEMDYLTNAKSDIIAQKWVTGFIQDSEGEPVKRALIQVGDAMHHGDEWGRFKFASTEEKLDVSIYADGFQAWHDFLYPGGDCKIMLTRKKLEASKASIETDIGSGNTTNELFLKVHSIASKIYGSGFPQSNFTGRLAPLTNTIAWMSDGWTPPKIRPTLLLLSTEVVTNRLPLTEADRAKMMAQMIIPMENEKTEIRTNPVIGYLDGTNEVRVWP